MRIIKIVLCLFLFVGCATTQPAGPHKVGSSFGGPLFRAALNPVTGNNATIIVFDSTVTPIIPAPERLLVTCRFDQAVTILYQVQRYGSSTWRTTNGSGDSAAANTDTFLDYLVLGPFSRIEVVTGSTGPSVAEINIGPVYDRPLAM
jgi:hypothetical protein